MKKLMIVFYTALNSLIMAIVFFILSNGLSFVHSNAKLMASVSIISVVSVSLAFFFTEMLEEGNENDEE